jgi:hypothetical protein
MSKLTIYNKDCNVMVETNTLINIDFEIDGSRQGISISIPALLSAVKKAFPVTYDPNPESFLKTSGLLT